MVKSVFIELRNAASRLNEWGRGNLLHVGTNTPLFFSSLSLGGVCECECVSVLQDLSSPTRDGTCAPAVEAPSPNPWVASSEKAPRTPALPKAALILPLSVSSCCIIFLQWPHQLWIFCCLFPHFGCKLCENRGFVLPSAMSPAPRTAPGTYQDSRNMDIYQIMCKWINVILFCENNMVWRTFGPE